MQQLLELVASLVIALSAAALAQFGVTLKHGDGCAHARAIPVVQRLPISVSASQRPTPVPAIERRRPQVRIVVTLA